jgi:hypothetical protein
MDEDTKEEIIELLMAIYKIPGQWFIGGIILLWIGKSMIEYTNYRYNFSLFWGNFHSIGSSFSNFSRL